MNPHLLSIQPSVIRALAAKKTPGSIDLGLGEPTLHPQQRFFEAATRWVAENGTKYTTNAGDFATRERIAKHYGYPGMSEARNVCMTTGSQEAVFVTIKTMLDADVDELLVVEPAFPAYAKMAQLEGIATRKIAIGHALRPRRRHGVDGAEPPTAPLRQPRDPSGPAWRPQPDRLHARSRR